MLKPQGSTPVSGSVSGKVFVRNNVIYHNSLPFVPRSFEITPSNNSSTATSRVTIYLTQSDFDIFNNAVIGSPLPENPTDSAGIAKLRVYKFTGAGDSTGIPRSYTPGVMTTLDPVDTEVLWNATKLRWEISFDVEGFSGFFVSDEVLQSLPVELATFTGKTTANGNLLKWTTRTENNTVEFALERSEDGMNFRPIALLAAKGSNSTYSFIDKDPLSQSYYRLKMIDRDQQFKYSYVVSLSSASVPTLKVNPNPASKRIVLRTSEKSGIVKIYDMHGNLVLQANWQQGMSLNITSIASGNYVVELRTATRLLRVQMIKVK
jgi:hypothetical protein